MLSYCFLKEVEILKILGLTENTCILYKYD